MYRIIAKSAFTVMAVFLAVHAGAGIRFAGLDLQTGPDAAASPEGVRLLFTAVSPANGRQQPFLARVDEFAVKRLSAYPEKLELIDGGRTLIVQSAYGIQSLSVSGGLPRALPGFPFFTGSLAAPGGADTVAASPDGKWLLFVEPSTFSRGNLVLINSETGHRAAVASSLERSGRFFPASWSADSRLFIYAKAGKLYFYPVDTDAPPPAENYRTIGAGNINSVVWANDSFYYLKGSIVYRVRTAELFAKTPYSDFLNPGTAAGAIPFEFAPDFDFFSVSDDGQAMIFAGNGRNIFYYPLRTARNPDPASRAPLPYIMLPRPGQRVTVLWGRGTATVILPGKTGKAAAYRIKDRGQNFEGLSPPPGSRALLSPDKSKAVIWGENGAAVYDYQRWTLLETVSKTPVLSCVWVNNEELVVGGVTVIERVGVGFSSEKSLVCLASVEGYGFAKDGSGILAQADGRWFTTDGTWPWTENPGPVHKPDAFKKPAQISQGYRVYLEDRRAGFFENMPMVRNLAGADTFALFPPAGTARRAIGEAEQKVTRLPEMDGVFSHGSRSLNKVALTFDLYDNDAGLYAVLEVLSRFGVTATFFLNGDFIRRYPEAAGDIAAAGHETGSLFYAPLDLSDSRYRVDRDFIARGLARNEDEYFKATGRELALMWHPPFYAVSPQIAAAAQDSGYRTVGRDIDPGDWMSRDDVRRIGIKQFAAADMIDRIMDTVRGGSIIPVRLGILSGGRDDYLFNSLDILLDALTRSGYEIAPVSRL